MRRDEWAVGGVGGRGGAFADEASENSGSGGRAGRWVRRVGMRVRGGAEGLLGERRVHNWARDDEPQLMAELLTQNGADLIGAESANVDRIDVKEVIADVQ